MEDTSQRPPNTQLFISEEYVADLEEREAQHKEKMETWKGYMQHVMDFLEILREHYGNFDKVLEHFNEADNGIDLVVAPDESIKFKPDENQES